MLINSPLPDSHGSLSKYIRLEDQYQLLKSIAFDTPISKLHLDRTIDHGVLTTTRARYMLVESGIVQRDKLINLIEDEGSLTEKLRMTMYFLFMLRDRRCRSFICNHVAGIDGIWTDSSLQLHNASFPEFDDAGTTKAYTNLRSFLVQVGLVSEGEFRLEKFPELDGWLSDAVHVAAQHIPDPELRQRFSEFPLAVLAEFGALGIISARDKDLVAFQGRPSPDEAWDLLPIYEAIGDGKPFSAAAIKLWDRTGPVNRTTLTAKAVFANPVLLERANGQHFLLEKITKELCNSAGMVACRTILIDLLAQKGEQRIIFEMKSCTLSSTRRQVRRGISQLLEYAFLYRAEILNPILCLVLERKPQGSSKWLIEYVESLGIGLLWKETQVDRLTCSTRTQELLEPYVGVVGG